MCVFYGKNGMLAMIMDSSSFALMKDIINLFGSY